jgi:hypothetical protein
MQQLLTPEAPAQRIGDLAIGDSTEEYIRRSAPSPLGEGAILERRVPGFLAPDILAPDILDLEVVRELPRRPRSPFSRFALAITIPAVVVIAAFLIFRTPSPGWSGITGGPQADSVEPRSTGHTQASVERRTQGTEQANSQRPRFVVLRAPPGDGDEAIPLGLSLAGASGNAALVLTGLPAGWTVSAGFPLGAHKWVVSASELSGAAIRPPPGFFGVIDLAVELRLADDTVPDRLSFRLMWVDAPRTTTVKELAQTAAAPQATSAPLRRLDRDEVDSLRKRGEEFMAAGNLGLARLAFQHAAEAGDPRAAFALATTYDPILLEARRVIGVVPNVASARAWYQKAKEFGSTDASLRLEMFTNRDH